MTAQWPIAMLVLLFWFADYVIPLSNDPPTTLVFVKKPNSAVRERTQEFQLPKLECAQKCVNVQPCVAFQYDEGGVCVISFVSLFVPLENSEVYEIRRGRASCNATEELSLPKDPLNGALIVKNFDCVANKEAVDSIPFAGTRGPLVPDPKPDCAQYCILKDTCFGVETLPDSNNKLLCYEVFPEPDISATKPKRGTVYLKMDTCTSIQGVISPWSISEKNRILDGINQLRSSVARGAHIANKVRMPSATNMAYVKWNYTLEFTAQKEASKCKWWADEHVFVTDKSAFTGTGQLAITAWSNELSKGWTSEMFQSKKGIDNVAQMLWAQTNTVGCGAERCSGKIFVVCHFWPRGNVPNKLIYNRGKTCSECPKGTTCGTKDINEGLCVSN